MKTTNIGDSLSIKETATYSLGSLGREISNNSINVFFLAYLNVVMGLDALVLTIAFVLAKLWDAINDPILARMINNSKVTRWGKLRPWIAIGAVLNGLSIILMFLPINIAESWKYVYYIGMYVLWGMSFTILDVPFWTMIPTMANNTHERNKISSMAKLIGGFGGFIISTVGTAIILPMALKQDIGTPRAYSILGFVTAILLITFLSATVFGNKEKYSLPQSNIGVKEIFKMFRQNDQLVAYAISYVLFVAATTISLFQILYIFIYYGESGLNLLRQDSYGLFTGIACAGQGIAMFFYAWITKKIPREKIYGSNYFMAIIGMLGMFFIFFVLGSNVWINVIIVSLAGAFLMTSNGLNQIGSVVMISDVVDYGEWKTGQRADSIIFSVQTLLTKFASAIAMLILGIGIKVAQLPTIVDNVDAETGAVTQSFNGIVTAGSLDILRIFMFLVPIPLCIIGYIIYKRKYTLFGDRYEQIKKEIEERRVDSGIDIYSSKVNDISDNPIEIDNTKDDKLQD